MGKSIVLKLEKDGETKEISFRTSGMGLVRGLRHISSAYKEGWNLIDCSGDADQVAFIKNVIAGQNPFDKGMAHGVKELAGAAGLDPAKIPKALKRLIGKKSPAPESVDPGAEVAQEKEKLKS